MLTELKYRLTGVNLKISPTAVTVPRAVATQLNATVTGIQSFSPDAAVRATLRGPSFPESIEIRATPNQPIFLPPLAQSGLHFLENIRLDVDANTSVKATPSVVNISVLDHVLVGGVTSRPLSLQEIHARGIQFDQNSFQAFEFTIALTTASGVKKVEIPVLVPSGAKEELVRDLEIPRLNLQLSGLDLPNLGLEPLMLEPIEQPPPGVEIPPIPGILVIPGNIAFLNQFFSAFLTVSNRAPDGTPLVVRNVRAEIRLPPGADGVMGDLQRDPPFAPGEPEFDNPLRIAKTSAGRQILKPVLAAGPDGAAGTADDVDVLVPQGSGSTEFLVQGIREGGHVVDIEIRGTLEGLPSGPIEVAGHVRGAVVVRDPNFALTFIHPDVVRAGIQYDLTVQIRNTSLVDANLVTVSLDPRNMTGARLASPDEGSKTIPTIRAGDSASVTLRLEALRTGRVTASTLELAGETGVVSGRRLSLRAGVSEQGVPLSSDTLILPPEVGRLRQRANNDELTSRAVALLGEAHSIATAPRASLPLGVLPIPSSTVIQRAGELTSAAMRLRLSYRAGSEGDAEPLPDGLLLTLQDLYFDFLGARVRDEGWDALYRSSRQARLFGAALAEVVGRESAPLGLADPIALQRHWADTESYRPDHVTLATSGVGGQVPVTLEVSDRFGRKLGGSLDAEGGRREIAGADILTFEMEGAPTGQFGVLTRTDASPYTATLAVAESGSVDLGIVVTDTSGQLRHVAFRAVTVSAGERLRLTIRPRSEPPVSFERASVPVVPSSQEVVVDGLPEVLGIVQITDTSVDRFGRVVGVLFDEDVQKASAENAASYKASAATIPMVAPPALVDANQVARALVQFGGRIVLVGLRDPVGPFVDRTLDVSGVRDLKGQVMASVTGSPILPDPDIGSGAQVTGRVLRADGTPVAGAEISYLQPLENSLGLDTMHVVTTKNADAEGRYGLDFVLQNPLGGFEIRARDVETREQGGLTAQVRANGERLALDIVLVGRGSVEGVVRRPSGTPLPGAAVRVVSGTDFTSLAGGTDQNGRYRITGVPVGPVALEVTASVGSARASGVITGSGATAHVDVTVFGATTGVVEGIVRLPDGTAAAGVQVTLASEVAIAGAPLANTRFLDVSPTDAAGGFRFEDVPAGGYLVRAIDRARGFTGDARITVTDANGPDNPVSVVVFLAGTGSVAGQVFELVGASAVPVPGALVAGGTQIVTADSDGRYLIPAVPVGARLIEAANPLNGARGSREVTILTAGQASTGVDIVLEALARITGRVISPDDQPVAGQEVRLIVSDVPSRLGGRTFFVRKTQTAADGTYAFDQLEPREYPLTVVRGNEVANGRARLSRLITQDIVDLRLIRPTGRVTGRVADETGLAVAARVALRARVPNAAGLLELADASSTTSDPDRGFTFTGLFPGPFAATASSFFSPGTAAVSGTLPDGNPVAENVVLVLSKNKGSLSGCVLAPDGTTIQPALDGTGIPLPLQVFITSRLLRNDLARDPLNTEPDGIRVDASDGCFTSSIPLPPDYYTIEATDHRPGSPTFGLTGQAFASVGRGAETTHNVRLLGLGSLAIDVVDANGQALPGVNVTVRRTSYPNDTRQAQIPTPTSTAPLLVEDLTEGPVSVSATVSSDPGVDVGGRDDLRGFGGGATGDVVRGELRAIRVVIDSAGVVSGRFLRVDGVTPVVGAQVQLLSSRPTAFALTDVGGAFRFDGVAAGSFRLDGFDPGTGRRARVDGHLHQDGQHVIQNLRLGPIGTVRGVVLDATRSAPRGGSEVQLTIPNDIAGARQATAAVDGAFVFESVPDGTATVTAVSLDGLAGRADATVSTEGEVVQVEVVLEGSGRVEGIVRDAHGTAVAAAQVTLVEVFGRRRTVQAGTSGADAGKFAFDVVPIGSFALEARPPGVLTPGDGGRATGEITSNGQLTTVEIAFEGTVTVGVVVDGAIGSAPVEVSLQSGGLFGGRATPTGVEGGVLLFEAIPRAPMTLSARQQTPAGVTISASVMLGQGDLPPPGGRVAPDVLLVLSQVATVHGVVAVQGGGHFRGARVTLSAGILSTLALTQSDGTFEFVGVPLDVPLRLEADGLDGGRAIFVGAIDDEGSVRDREGHNVDMVLLTLDVTPPRVTAVFPLSGAIAIPTNTSVTFALSEPIDPVTITSCALPPSTVTPNIRLLESSGAPPSINDPANLCDDSNVVPVSIAVAADGRSVTLQPARSLSGSTQHTVSVSRGVISSDGTLVGGVRDLIGLPLEADFTWQFVTRDDVPPAVLTLSPPAGAVNVPEESVIRVTFTEPIAPASVTSTSFAVVGPAGPVTGVRKLILGNTVAVFTPADAAGGRALLQSNSTYTVVVAGVVDLSGNAQRPQDAVSATFSIRDTIAPTIATISAPTGARSDETLTVTTTTNTDVASVEFFVDGMLTATSAQPVSPGTYRASFLMPARSIQVAARAVDTSGNVGALSGFVAVALLPDNAPVVAITAPSSGATFAAGATVRFVVDASDDLGVVEIRAASSGAVTTTVAWTVSPARTPVTEFFDVPIPLSAVSGPLTFAAGALDRKGQTSQTATLTLDVTGLSENAVISSVSPAEARQGQTRSITIIGQDTNFLQGTTTATFGPGVTVNDLTVTSVVSAVANISIAEDAAPGPRTVTLTTGPQKASLVNGFTIAAGAAVLTTVTPAAGTQGETLMVNVSGRFTHFAQGVTTADFGPGVTVDVVTVNSPVSASVTVTVNPIAATGTRNVTLTTVGEVVTLGNSFGVQRGTAAIAHIAPDAGEQGQTLDVNVTGVNTHFQEGLTTASFGSGIVVNIVTVNNATSATANISIGAGAPLGARTVAVTTGGESAELVDGFTVAPSAAAVAAVNPVAGAQGQSLNVTITGQGTHFVDGVTTATFGPDIVVNSVRVNDATSAIANITIAFNASVGVRTVTVNTHGESASLVDGFWVTQGVARIVAINPASARQGDDLAVGIVGEFTNFVPGLTTADFGPGILIKTVSVISPVTARVELIIDEAADTGSRTVTVTTETDVVRSVGGFTVTPGLPAIINLDPSAAEAGDTVTVVITARFTHFVQGVTTADFGSGITTGLVTVNGPTRLSVPVNVARHAFVGNRQVRIATNGEIVTATFGVSPGTPSIELIDPNVGRPGQTLSITVSGQFTSWQQGATTASLGPDISVGGANEGEFGPVSMTGPDLFVATLVINALAPLGPRDLAVRTGTTTLTVASGFTVTTEDTTAPGLLTASPENGSFDVPLNSLVTLEFNEPIDRATVTSTSLTLQDTVTGAKVPGNVSVDATGRIVRFEPQRLFAVNRRHFVIVNGITDTAGNRFPFFFVVGFTTGFTTDFTGPELVETSPSKGAGDIPLNAELVLQFTEQLNATTRRAGLRVTTGGLDVGGTFTFSDVKRVVTFKPAAPLFSRTLYTVIYSGELRDVAGNPLANSGSFSFTTGTTADATRPLVTLVTPPKGATGVGRNVSARVTFSEVINPISVSRTFPVSEAATGRQVGATVSVAPDRRSATLRPAVPLQPNTTYVINLWDFTFADVAGNVNRGVATSFTTSAAEDTEAPVVVAISPHDGTMEVPVNAWVVARFSEPVDPLTVNETTITLEPAAQGAVSLGSDGLTVTFTPAAPYLRPATSYVAHVSGVRDLAGQVMAPVTSTFTTTLSELPGNNLARAAGVTTNVSSSYPGWPAPRGIDGDLRTSWFTNVGDAVNRGTTPFFEVVLPGEATITQLRMFGNREFPSGFDFLAGIFRIFNGAGDTLFDSGVIDLPAPDRDATVVVPSVAGARRVRFTATADEGPEPGFAELEVIGQFADPALGGVPDTAAPVVLATSPPAGATGVAVTSPVVITISEPIVAGAVTAASVRVWAQVGGSFVQVPGSYTVNAVGTEVVFTPLAPYPASTNMGVNINQDGAIRDLAGNGLRFAQVVFTTAATPDVTAPVVTAVMPADGTTEVGPNAVVVVTFSEPVNPGTVTGSTMALFSGPKYLAGPTSLSADNQSVGFSTPLPLGSIITVVVTKSVRDLTGNAVADFSSTFTTRAAVDVTHPGGPAIVTQRPGPGATGVPMSTSVTLYANEPLNAATIPGALHVSQNGVLVTGRIEVSAGGQAIQFIPDAPFLPGALVQVFLDATAEDEAGHRLFSHSSQFTIAPDTTTTAPVLQRVTPVSHATGLPRNVIVELEFNEPLDPATVVEPAVRLEKSTGLVVPSTITLRAGGRVVRLVPLAPLQGESVYVVVIETDRLRDLQGAAYPQFFVSRFTTGAEVDEQVPRVVAVTPPAGATGVGVNALLRVTFDEAINPLTVSDATIRVSGNARDVMAASVSFDPTNRLVTLTPLAPLPDAALVTIVIDGVEDRAGNAVTPLTTTFTTLAGADLDRPQVVRTSVFNGQRDVPVNSVLTVEVDEPLDAQTVGLANVILSDNTTRTAVDISVDLSPDGRSVTLAPTKPLAVGRWHTISFRNVNDLAGNGTSVDVVSFVTAFGADTTPPTIVVTNPGDGVTAAPRNAQVQVRFDEPVQPTSLGAVHLTANGAPVPVTPTLSDGNRTLTLVTQQPLVAAAVHVVSIGGVKDPSGNVMRDAATVMFTVGPGFDLVAPFVTLVTPPDGGRGVGRNVSARVAFSEVINPITVSRERFRLSEAGTGQLAGATVSVAADRRSATLRPTAPLQPNTRYVIDLGPTVADMAGNLNHRGVLTSFTTSAAEDTEAPVVVAISPRDGTMEVPVNAWVVARFSEPVDPLTVNETTITLEPAAQGAVSLGSDGLTVTFTPAAPYLRTATSYMARVSGVRDLAGQVMAPVTSTFTTSLTGLPGNNLARAAAVTTNVSSSYPGRPAPRGIDGDLRTSWFTNVGDAVNRGTTPFFEVVLPGEATITQLRMFGNREAPSGFDFLAGIFRIFNGAGDTLFDSGVIDLPAPDRDATVVVPSVAGARRVRFTATADEGPDPGFAELEVIGQFADPAVAGAVPDTTAPVVLATSPPAGATGVAVTSPVVITISEPIVAGAVTAASVPVYAQVGGIGFVQVPGSYTVNAAGTEVVFTPQAPYPASTNMRVNINNDGAIRDLAGNGLRFAQVVFTTAATPDVTAPVVTAVMPADGTTEVGPNAVVVVTFSEPVNPSTVTGSTMGLFSGPTYLAGPTSLSADNQSVGFSTPLPLGSIITVFVTKSVRDLTGNAVADFSSTFTTRAAVDVTHPGGPAIVTQRPGPGATGVPMSTSVTLYANEPLNAATIPGALHVSQNGVLVTGRIEVSAGGQAIQFIPDAPFLPGALVQVFLDATAEDEAGHRLFSYSSQFTIEPDTTTTAPILLRVTPVPSATGLPRNVVVELEFNEPLDPATVVEPAVRLQEQSTGTVVPSTLTLGHGGRVVRLVPLALLQAGAGYVVVIENDRLRDLQGAASPQFFVSRFTTGAEVDEQVPRVAAVTPPAGATGVGVNALLRVTFDEPINPLTVSDATIRVSGNARQLMAGSISFDPTNRLVTLTPLEPLPDGTLVTLTVDGVEDRAGNAVPPMTTAFTTRAGADMDRPQVVRTSVFDRQRDVPVNSVLAVETNEPLDAQTVGLANVILRDNTTGTAVDISVELSPDGRTVTLTPTAPLAVGRWHTISFNVKDLAGNGAGWVYVVSFVTAFEADTTPPSIVVTNPGDGVTATPRNAQVQVRFDEPVQPTSLGAVHLTANGSPAPITRTLSDGNRTLTLTPPALLAAATLHAVSVEGGVRDTAGNPLATTFEATFVTTTAVDFAHPSVTAFFPVDGAVDVPATTSVEVKFDESINPLSAFLPRSVRLFVTNTGETVQTSLTFSSDFQTVILTPLASLASGTRYTIEASSGITDQASNRLPFTIKSSFTTQ